ncbi:MAG: ABC transporter permease [Lachnospiraceae bacterium]|nr:ABC transporter permease [Lachnospiraceae bacterium]
MKNPLNKRLFRELRADLGKYLVVFVVMVIIIGEGSGFLVAAHSMLKAYNDSFEKYDVEYGNFRISEKLSKSVIKAIENNEKVPVKLYENFYVEENIDNGSVLRTFINREEINRASIHKGRLPKEKGEIAIDRMYADNNKLKVGDTLSGENGSYKITGLIALSDYSTMFRSNDDIMFDAKKFGVATVSKDSFDEFPTHFYRYSYSWLYENEPADEKEETDMAEDLMKEISSLVTMEDFVPRYANQAIYFTGEDFSGDAVMIRVFVYIVIVILAFVFGIMINNTIQNEAENIGTLRASGYTRNEIIFHYMLPPLFVTFVSALIGNILGYTIMEKINSDLYYNSYSLPKYEKLFNPEAFFETTLIPVGLMIVITYFSLHKKLKISPLNFLRNDLSKKGRKRAFYLSRKIPFFTRFRMRVIFQNATNYIVLLFGLFFANFLLVFGLAFPALLDDYAAKTKDNMFSKYQYILQVPMDVLGADTKLKQMIAAMEYQGAVETENENAEKFTAYSLKTTEKNIKEESVSFYGIENNSKYVNLKLDDDDFYVSRAYAEKFKLKIGDMVTLKEEYANDKYTFKVTGIFDYMGSISAYMTKKAVNEKFDLGDSYFSGYFSDDEITDIDPKYISTVIDYESLTKVSRQLQISMGGFMVVVQYASMVIFMVLVYLLSKIIIEKNQTNISMAKILGYKNNEISSLYVHATSIMSVLFIIATIIITSEFVVEIFKVMIRLEMNGWFDIYVSNNIKLKMFVMGIVTYAIVALLEFRKVKKIPMSEALKSDG